MIMLTKPLIQHLVHHALSGDALTNRGGHVIHAMTQSADRLQDVAQVSEAFSLLAHYLHDAELINSEASPCKVLLGGLSLYVMPDITHDTNKLLVLTIPIGEGELRYVAHWICDSLRSDELASMDGSLCLPFIVEHVADKEQDTIRLYPDWMACFYPKNNPANCFPLLVLESMIKRNIVPDDWVPTALHRLSTFNLPVDQALANLTTVNVASA